MAHFQCPACAQGHAGRAVVVVGPQRVWLSKPNSEPVGVVCVQPVMIRRALFCIVCRVLW